MLVDNPFLQKKRKERKQIECIYNTHIYIYIYDFKIIFFHALIFWVGVTYWITFVGVLIPHPRGKTMGRDSLK